MPIDDIQYLYQNNVKENIVLLIDSNKRDRKRWRSPAEFVVEFPEPFKNVYGVELLNASVARTMFTIDKHNNKMSILTNNYVINTYKNVKSEYKYTDIYLSITDYKDANKMMDELSNVLENASDQYDKTFSAVTAVEAQDTSTDITTKQFLKFTSSKTPFIINRRFSSSNKTFGFSMLADEIDDDSYKVLKNCINTDIVSFSTIHMDNYEQIIFTDKFSISPSDMNIIEETDTHKIVSLHLKLQKKYNSGVFIKSIVRSNTKDTHIYDDLTNMLKKKFTLDDVILQIAKDFEIVNDDEIKIEYYHLIDNLKTITSENEDELFISKTVINNLLDINVHYRVDVSDNKIDINKTGETTLITTDNGVFVKEFEIEINQLNTVYLLKNKKTIIHVKFTEITQNIVFRCEYYKYGDKYFIKYVKPSDSQYFNHIHINLSSSYTLSVLYDNGIENITIDDDVVDVDGKTISSLKSFELFTTTFSITPPGIINFATENYVTLHIKEIEEHIRGSYDANDVSPGIAMLNVDVQSGYADNATEFTRVEYKEFHPIGKLSKLHFRLQRKLTTELYDCKGVDVHYLLSIKMLNPSKLNTKQLEYSLNPNYDPDYQGFMKSEFDNVESDEEIESKNIREEHYDRERELQNLKNNIDRNFVNLESESDEESESGSELDSEYETE
mgnify:CR=1 FL=1|tara:strand:- start:786 stop:2798 length:2013 start_codon:yes stop_codon:yes gene_type:complete